MFLCSVNRNPNRSPEKSIQILIGTRTNKSESQSKHGQSMSRSITARSVHEVDEYKVHGIMQVYYINRSNVWALYYAKFQTGASIQIFRNQY